jgi:hypothetical protein
VSGWGQYLDDLAAAVAELLHEGAVRPAGLSDPQGALVARDAVLIQLRELIGAVADVPQFVAVSELTVHDAVHRPAQSLHQALTGLPRAISFGDAELPGVADSPDPGYEQAWQRAAQATIGLQCYGGALRELPDAHAWHVLRDLTDLAAAIPYLDHDLSEAILPALKTGQDLDVPYRMLTHPGHAAVRMVAAEIRARVPPVEQTGRGPATSLPPTPVRKAVRPGAAASGSGAAPSNRRRRATPPAPPGPDPAGQVAEAMTRLAHGVSARGPNVSVPDLRAVTRLLEVGSAAAARVLERAAVVLDGGRETADNLSVMAAAARDLRAVPVKAMTPPHLELMRLSTDLQDRLDSVAVQAARLPAAASPHDLRRLAAPALEYAQHAPSLAAALDMSAREAIAAGLMLVPGTVSWRPELPVTWVTARMRGPARPGPPEIVEGAGELTAAGRRTAPWARLAGQNLARHAAVALTPTEQAAADARRQAGAARQELRATLAGRIAAGPTVLAPDLPRHPALAPPPPSTARRR